MRGITSGLEPRRYAEGDLVQKALDLGVTPFGMSDEEIMEAIVAKTDKLMIFLALLLILEKQTEKDLKDKFKENYF
jgi:hypothetical protein